MIAVVTSGGGAASSKKKSCLESVTVLPMQFRASAFGACALTDTIVYSPPAPYTFCNRGSGSPYITSISSLSSFEKLKKAGNAGLSCNGM